MYSHCFWYAFKIFFIAFFLLLSFFVCLFTEHVTCSQLPVILFHIVVISKYLIFFAFISISFCVRPLCALCVYDWDSWHCFILALNDEAEKTPEKDLRKTEISSLCIFIFFFLFFLLLLLCSFLVAQKSVFLEIRNKKNAFRFIRFNRILCTSWITNIRRHLLPFLVLWSESRRWSCNAFMTHMIMAAQRLKWKWENFNGKFESGTEKNRNILSINKQYLMLTRWNCFKHAHKIAPTHRFLLVNGRHIYIFLTFILFLTAH